MHWLAKKKLTSSADSGVGAPGPAMLSSPACASSYSSVSVISRDIRWDAREKMKMESLESKNWGAGRSGGWNGSGKVEERGSVECLVYATEGRNATAGGGTRR